jgi:hypothetical protein
MRATTSSALLLLALAAAASGCQRGPGDATPPAADITTLPAEPPSITGTVTAVTLPTVRVEERPEEATGSAKASLRITDETRVLRRAGDSLAPGRPADLHVGQRVRAWFVGPVAESYPVQARAGTIIIDR